MRSGSIFRSLAIDKHRSTRSIDRFHLFDQWALLRSEERRPVTDSQCQSKWKKTINDALDLFHSHWKPPLKNRNDGHALSVSTTVESYRIIDQYPIIRFNEGSLCQPDSRHSYRRDSLPFCLRSLNRFASRCSPEDEPCLCNPCLNNGTSVPDSRPDQVICLCSKKYSGGQCQWRPDLVLISHFPSPSTAWCRDQISAYWSDITSDHSCRRRSLSRFLPELNISLMLIQQLCLISS